VGQVARRSGRLAGQRLHTWPLALSPVRTWCTICTVSFPKPCASQLPGTWIGPVCTAGPSAPPASLLGVGEWSENCQVPSSEKDCRAEGGAEAGAAAPRRFGWVGGTRYATEPRAEETPPGDLPCLYMCASVCVYMCIG